MKNLWCGLNGGDGGCPGEGVDSGPVVFSSTVSVGQLHSGYGTTSLGGSLGRLFHDSERAVARYELQPPKRDQASSERR